MAATDVIGTVSYTLAGADAGSFNIDAATGQLQTSATLDYETKSRYEVIVTATDSTGSVDIMVAIEVTNVIELQPITGPATVGYEENRAVRVAAYSASSEADLGLLTWSLSGPDAGSFRIDEPGGVLRFDLPVVPPISSLLSRTTRPRPTPGRRRHLRGDRRGKRRRRPASSLDVR